MKFKVSRLSRFKHQTNGLYFCSRGLLMSSTTPKSWGYVEVQQNETSVETTIAYSSEEHGGQAWAYDKVKELKKAKILRAFHGIVQEEQLIVVEQYDPKSKRREEPTH